MISRRKFIQNTGAGLFLTAVPYTTNALNNIKKYELTAKKSKYSFEKNQNKTDLWLFNNNCPGPLITANKNDLIEIKIDANSLIKKNILYTPSEKFKKLVEINPYLEKLRKELDLDY